MRFSPSVPRFGAVLLAGLLGFYSVSTSGQSGPGFVSSLQKDAAGNLVLHWPSQAGRLYRIESSPDLTTWTDTGPAVAGTGSELTAVVLSAGPSIPARQFWRVVSTQGGGIGVPASTGIFTSTLASVAPQIGVSYAWTIAGGDFTEQNGAPTVRFVASSPGTVTLTCTITDNATHSVVATYSTQVAVVDAPVQPIVVAPGFSNAGQADLRARVENQPGCTFAWGISGGTISAGAGTNEITFTAGPAGTLTLTCTVARNGTARAAAPATVRVLADGAGTWEAPLSETSLPPLQVNLSSEGSRLWMFANMLRTSEAWIYRDGANAAQAQALARQVQLDSAGWPLVFPTGTHMRMAARYQTGESTYLHGVYVLTWEGAGSVVLSSSRNNGIDEQTLLNDQAHGRIVKLIRTPSKYAVVLIDSSDPSNPVRNMRLWAPAEDGAGLHITPTSDLTPGHVTGSLEPAPGQPEPLWHPRFLAHLAEAQHYGVLRFMSWLNINAENWDCDALEWSDRADPAYGFGAFNTIDSAYNRYPVAAYRQRLGLPYEWMIDLCNATSKDLWIQVPHVASADLIRQLARLCATRLDPGRRVWFEYSNELWNGIGPYLPQQNRARTAAAVHFGVPYSEVSFEQIGWGSGYLQGLALKTFEDEWRAQGQSDARLVNVVASFVSSSGFSQRALAAAREIDPRLPEVLAVTNYFGYGTQFDIFAQHNFGATPGLWPESLFARTQSIVRRNLYDTADSWRASAAVARAAGLPLVSYEGGQHMLPLGLGDWNNPAHTDFMYFMYAFQRSPHIKELYLEHYALWSAMGGRTVSLFVDTGSMSFWGYWGAKEFVTQTRANCAKWDAFVAWSESEAGVRAPSEPLATRPLLPALTLTGEAQLPFSRDFTATGGEGPVQIQLIGGALPPGLALSPLGSGAARLAGTPTTDGVYRFVLRALDANLDPDYRAYTLVIDPAGVTANALVVFRGLDTPATIPNNGWIGRYDPARPYTVLRNASNVVTRIYLPFSIADGQALFNRENLEVPGTPKTIPATSPLNMYGGWSLTSQAPASPPRTPALSMFNGLRDYQWSSWAGDGAGNPTALDALLLWRADQFNPLGGSGPYSFGADASTALLRVDFTSLIDDGDNQLRFVVRDAGTYYLSEAAFTSQTLGDGYFQLGDFSGNPAPGYRWAVIAPTVDNYAIPAAASLTFTAHAFTDVQAVGLAYHGRRWGYHFAFNFSRFLALGRRQ